MKKLKWLGLGMVARVAFAQVPISQLPPAATLGGGEAVPMVQSSTTVKGTTAQIATYVVGTLTYTTITGLFSGCSGTDYLGADGACHAVGSGAVTSVGLTMPTGFTVSGSPVTASGTLAVTTTLDGIILGSGSGFTTAAASNVVSLFSGCSGTNYLGADGECHSAGTGTVTSVGLTDGSAAPIFAITGSPVTTSGTLTETLSSQDANLVFAGPASGSAAQPTFRALVGADIPALGANPTASVGLTAVDGSATTYLRSDSAPALSQSISPTWTGNHVFAPTVGTTTVKNIPNGDGLTLEQTDTGADTGLGMVVERAGSNANQVSQGAGFELSDTSNSTDTILQQSGGQTELWQYNGSWARPWYTGANGGLVVGAPTGGSEGAGTVNTTGVYVNGGAIGPGANPTASVGLTAVDGSATTYMRSDAAPAISQSISPTWTGTHIWSGTGTQMELEGTSAILSFNETGGTELGYIRNLSTGLYIEGNVGILALATGNGIGLDITQGGVIDMPLLAASTAAQTGYLCWSNTLGELTYDTTNTCLVSSEKYKDDIRPFSGGLKEVLALAPIVYRLKPAYDPGKLGDQLGLTAEAVARVDPRLAAFDPGSKTPRSVQYDRIAVLDAAAIQDQQREIESLSAGREARAIQQQQLEIKWLGGGLLLAFLWLGGLTWVRR